MRIEVADAIKALEVDGKVTPQRVVDAARDPDSPLHAEFDWDDASAANSYRVARARYLIGAVVYNVKTKKLDMPVIAYVRDPEKGPKEQGYASTVSLKTRRDLAEQALAQEIKRAIGHIDRVLKAAEALDIEVDINTTALFSILDRLAA